jgi:hypothetical protein
MMSERPHDPWDSETWAGSRRAQLRRALAMTVRERLEAMEAAIETGRHLAAARRHAVAEPRSASERDADS